MKKILGLDLGTNSIGWALVSTDDVGNPCKIDGMGSRIIPMGAEKKNFEQGQAQTKNADRRTAKGSRKGNKRYKQRRNKLIYILQQLNMLPEQIQLSSTFDNPNKIDKISIKPIAKKQKQLTAFDLVNLRVKALTESISLKDFGRILYLYNQLRGYSGGNAEPDKEDNNDDEVQEKKGKESFVAFSKIVKINKTERVLYKGKELTKSSITIEVDDEQISDNFLEGDTFLENLKEGESLEFQININRNKKREITSIFFRLPSKTNWRKKMENIEQELKKRSKSAGREIFISEYLLSVLEENPFAKIRDNVILRSRYESEFDIVWKTQYEKNPEFKQLADNTVMLENIISFIFPDRPKQTETKQSKNSQKEKYKEQARTNGLKHLIKNQIIYYQRELKEQSHLISDCRFEKNEKVVAKSHPVFQEYKIWEQINKLTINTKIQNGINRKGDIKYKYIDKAIPIELKEWLFDELQEKKDLSFKQIFTKLKTNFGLQEGNEFLNGMNPKSKLVGDTTKLQLKKTIGNDLWKKLNLDDKEKQIELWDILYNGKGNEYDLNSDRTQKVHHFINASNPYIENSDVIAIQISKIKFSRSYGAMSLKAITKILPLVRVGKYFNCNFSKEIQNKIVKLLNETVSDPFEKSAQEYLENNIDYLTEGGIVNAMATILVYGQHTTKNFSKEELIANYSGIKRLESGCLRNPLVEQIVSETLILVREIWMHYGEKPHEIRIELARDLKNNAERRKKVHESNRKRNEENNNVRERLIEHRIEISNANIEKYKLWEEQGHISPYTGQPIPFSNLFNKGLYDIDHIIPKSRYFDDSFTNKVVAETAINRDKGNRTSMEYFEAGSIMQKILEKEKFIDTVNKKFSGVKRKNLLATKVPEDPVLRQIKETQYISIKVKEELSKIVGNEHVYTTTGGVTDYLKNQWGLTDKFKKLLKPRYEALLIKDAFFKGEYDDYKKEYNNKKKKHEEQNGQFNDDLLSPEDFRKWIEQNYIQWKNNKLIIKGWSKRIDHRHHAMDALVVACTRQAHIQRLNNLNKELQEWLDKNRNEILPDLEGGAVDLLDEIMNLDNAERVRIQSQIEKFRAIEMPWQGFPEDVESKLQEIIVSHKPKDKLIIQKDKDGKDQIKIRGQLHEGTLYGKAGKGIYKKKNGECYRIPLSKLAGSKFATEKTIEKIVNRYLREQISEHLKSYGGKKEEAFSADGILNLNSKLATKTNKKRDIKPHTSISKIRIYYQDPKNIKEGEGKLQRLDREKAFNQSLYVKTGGNYLFAILEKEKEKRIYDIISFFDAANLLKAEFNDCTDKTTFNKEIVFKKYFEEKNKAKLLFTLKQDDLVYFPLKNEDVILDSSSSLFLPFWNNYKSRAKNIFVVQKFSKSQIYFLKHTVSDTIKKGIEFGSQNCYELVDDRSIKEFCIPIKLDRLGNIIEVSFNSLINKM